MSDMSEHEPKRRNSQLLVVPCFSRFESRLDSASRNQQLLVKDVSQIVSFLILAV